MTQADEGGAESASPRGAGKAVELVDVPFYPQEEHHCGPASLLTMLEHSGVSADYESVVRQVYVPGLKGSLQVEMQAASRGFGRIVYPLPAEPMALFAEVSAGRPALVLLNLGVPSRPFWHYAVVVGFDPESNRVLMRSGEKSRRRKRAPAWFRQWDWAGRWAIVLLRPEEWPVEPQRERLLQAMADFEDHAPAADAGRAWQSAVDHWPDEPIAWLGVGNAAYRLEDWSAAQEAYRQALVLAPENAPARFNLAQSLLEGGRPCDGLEALGPPPSPDHPLLATFEEIRESLRERCPAAPLLIDVETE
jgi:hypothetical protein